MNFVRLPEAEAAEAVQGGYPVLRNMDARNISSLISGSEISLTLTSPPYFDVKDYKSEGQIGFGQDYESYLSDLCGVFQEVYKQTTNDGSLWIVIDSFRRGGELIPLPFDLAARLKLIGWHLKDVIIWKKDRTLPWAKDGATRNIFEYILVLAKNAKDMKYFPDRVRDHTDLKHWWVRYPERYSPKGKSLEEVWPIDIPVQGSWGAKSPRHACPLPPALVRRVLRLTTNEGDTVLDPFAGTGVVLTQAHRLRRRSLGSEIDQSLVESFYGRLNDLAAIEESEDERNQAEDDRCFERMIIQLRVLKFARLLLRSLRKNLDTKTLWIYADQAHREPSGKYAIVAADYLLVTGNSSLVGPIEEHAQLLTKRTPLSKFGIDADIRVVTEDEFNSGGHANKAVYGYSVDNTHKFKSSFDNLVVGKKQASVFSPLGINIDEHPEY